MGKIHSNGCCLLRGWCGETGIPGGGVGAGKCLHRWGPRSVSWKRLKPRGGAKQDLGIVILSQPVKWFSWFKYKTQSFQSAGITRWTPQRLDRLTLAELEKLRKVLSTASGHACGIWGQNGTVFWSWTRVSVLLEIVYILTFMIHYLCSMLSMCVKPVFWKFAGGCLFPVVMWISSWKSLLNLILMKCIWFLISLSFFPLLAPRGNAESTSNRQVSRFTL